MPHQQFDANMDRVAGQRRCEEDDQESMFAVWAVCTTAAGDHIKRTPVVEPAQLVPHARPDTPESGRPNAWEQRKR